MIKRLDHPQEIVSIIRMQKWGVREHLDDGMPLLQAMFKSDEYTEYVLDRRFACHHLGMNIPKHVTTRKVCERYVGSQTGPAGTMIWSPYFRRAYIPGIATDKMPRQRFQDTEFSLGFARQLGLAAAPNIIVGRCDDIEDKVLFDDGDEVMIEDARGMPAEIKVADQTGTFVDYLKPLQVSAAAYADPVNRRIEYLPDPEGFARAYLDAFVEKFSCVQEKYRRRRKAFDTLFKNRPYSVDGSLAYRWEQVLKRLDRPIPANWRKSSSRICKCRSHARGRELPALVVRSATRTMLFPPRRTATRLVWQCRLSQDILSGRFHSDWVTPWQAKTSTSAAVPFRSPTGTGSLAGDPISASILSVAMSMQGSTSTGTQPVTRVAARDVCEKSAFASDRAGLAAECSPRIES